ncbi:hypothetical protein BDW02DRAFT_117290 [Decorospora gaudefroyi]|uniref:Uncharacterized protein n=1 Tax=Decorospora gaudefroyi TaxID=184978 RepID=A0A6A5JYP0_9PLEO|nr:hypothetical protein BDW02DRAFT_117290 [Decorospora gaudefroyi]
MSNPSAPLNILISGSAIAGHRLAFRLAKFIPTCRIAILEQDGGVVESQRENDNRSRRAVCVCRWDDYLRLRFKLVVMSNSRK